MTNNVDSYTVIQNNNNQNSIVDSYSTYNSNDDSSYDVDSYGTFGIVNDEEMFSDYDQSTPSVLQYSSPAISNSVFSNQGSSSFSNSVDEGPIVLEVILHFYAVNL